jgi:hypothetical protein
MIIIISRSRWPCWLRLRSADARLLGSRVRIPLTEWMFVSDICCVLCMWRPLITRSEESYWVCALLTVCMSYKPQHRGGLGPTLTLGHKKIGVSVSVKAGNYLSIVHGLRVFCLSSFIYTPIKEL